MRGGQGRRGAAPMQRYSCRRCRAPLGSKNGSPPRRRRRDCGSCRRRQPSIYLAVSLLRNAIRSARSSGFFSPANTILVPAGC